MLWVSDALDVAGRPAVQLLGASLTRGRIVAEAAYVASVLPAGKLGGTLYAEGATSPGDGVRVSIEWPAGWPEGESGLPHPRECTPELAREVIDGAWHFVAPVL